MNSTGSMQKAANGTVPSSLTQHSFVTHSSGTLGLLSMIFPDLIALSTWLLLLEVTLSPRVISTDNTEQPQGMQEQKRQILCYQARTLVKEDTSSYFRRAGRDLMNRVNLICTFMAIKYSQ